MRIIILGAGQVGRSLVEHLVSEKNHITVVDTNPDRLQMVQELHDVNILCAHGAHPVTLSKAGADDADMLVAVTNSDEVNMIACQVGQSLFHVPNKVARVREPGYMEQNHALFAKAAVPVDVLINPEALITQHLKKLIRYPGALQVINFAGGLAQLVAVRATTGGALVGQRISALRERLPAVEIRVAAIFRQNHAVVPDGDTLIQDGDEVFFVAARPDIRLVLNELRRREKPYKRLVIAGGGNIGARLASVLEDDYRVKVIEQDMGRCQYLSERLRKATVLYGSASDRELLLEESIESADVFLALTNDDEANIMSSMLAKRMGARTVITLISNPAYAELVQGGSIDIAISPQQATIGALLTHVRRGDVVAVHSLRRGTAEAMEAVAHGDPQSSQVVGKRIDELPLPPGAMVGAVVRGEDVIIAHDSTQIEEGDHVIVLVPDKRDMQAVERLFQVGLTFLL